MLLLETDAKRCLALADIQVPRGKLCRTAEEARDAAAEVGLPVAVKAQVKQWGRGHSGLVKRCDSAQETSAAFAAIQRLGPAILSGGSEASRIPCLVEEWLPLTREVYLAELVDPDLGGKALLFSGSGGVEIESNRDIGRALVPVSTGPTSFHERRVIRAYGLDASQRAAVGDLLVRTDRVFSESDARLLELNPLGWSQDIGFVAIDVKLVIDDNALGRHSEFIKLHRAEDSKDPSDELRIEHRIEYAELNGNIGLISGGAGMTMAVMDLISARGGRPRCFLDCSQNPTDQGFGFALDMLLQDANTKSILINIIGGGTAVDRVAQVFVQLLSDRRHERRLTKPIFFRLEGTNSKRANEILEQNHIPGFVSLESAIDTAIAAAVSVP